jgi:hypothetical protein
MIKKALIFIFFIFNILVIFYLLSPVPIISDLPNSIKSTEPGDTIQIPNVSAYYTNQTRTQVINYYKAIYYSPFRIILNHPPEKAREIIRDTLPSYYFEEFVIPFKESLYINGFEWENDVFTKPDKRVKNKLLFEGKEYKAKITIRTFPVSLEKRLISFFFSEAIFIIALLTYKSFLKKSHA